ncbi:MAG: ATP-binding protein [Candidatus Limnocylindria bacterium]
MTAATAARHATAAASAPHGLADNGLTAWASDGRIPRSAGAVAVGVGLAVLVGWVLGAETLKSFLPGHVAMKANTAVAWILIGGSLVVLSRADRPRHWAVVGNALAIAAALLAVVIGSQYILGRDLGIDQVLFAEPRGAVLTVDPGRMSPQTSISFVLVASAIVLTGVPLLRRWVPWLACGPILLGLLNLLDQLYAASVPTFLAAFTQMAFPTAALCVFTGLAVMHLLPDGGPMAIFRGTGSAARLSRRLLVAAVVIPLALGWLRLQGERAGLYDSAYGVVLITLATMLLFVVVVRQTSVSQARADAERTASEAALQQARVAAEKANRAKSEFLSRMSHELRTPLNSILGFGQLLELDKLSEEQRESVRYIVKGGRHLLQLIDEVLDIARIETGRLTMSPEAIRVRDVVDDALVLIGPLAAERSLTVEVEGLADADRHVRADRQRLKQVLINLLSNAVKYNRERGTVRVSASEPAHNVVRIAVRDTGHGIDASKLSRLFTPFDRLGVEGTSVEGTGIGPALSKALVEAMGGTIGVETVVREGTTFWVDLAIAESPLERYERLQRASTALQPARHGVQKRVLYIEDNVPNIKLVERVMELRPDVEGITATTGRQGLHLARVTLPEVLLLDLDLPEVRGEEILRRLKQDEATAAIPVIILSADATEGSVKRLLAEGARDYLTKPLDVEQLIERIDRVLATPVPA